MGFSSPDHGHQHAHDQVVLSADPPTLPELVVQPIKLRFYNDETGFFVLEASPSAPLPPLPPELSEYALSARRAVTVKGCSMVFRGNDQVGNTLSCRGRWVVDPSYGLQFETAYMVEVIPSNPEGLLKYLASGRLKGIGPSTAQAIMSKWGMDTLRILSEEPMLLAQIPGISSAKALAIGTVWSDRKDSFETVAFFGQYGIGEALALRILDQLGKDNLLMRVRQNPYSMTEVEGVGFKTADQMAMALGFQPDCLLRIESALTHVLQERIQQGGNTAIPVEEWKRLSAAYLDYPIARIEPICADLIKSHRVVCRVLDAPLSAGEAPVPVDCVSPIATAITERVLAKQLRRLGSTAHRRSPLRSLRLLNALEDPVLSLDPSQKAAAWALMANGMAIMTGGPGTGKTTTLRTVVRVLQEQGDTVVLAAPTGRAAKRMEEAIGVSASTIHRRLRYDPSKSRFLHDENNPMTGDVFILDEASMVDSALAAAWLRAIPSSARAIFVGDVDQLASVGPGDVLRNLIQSSRLPVARLTTVHRQAEGSGIAQAAHAILAGRAPVGGEIAGSDFSFVRAADNAAIANSMEHLIRHHLGCGFSHRDIQVLCPQKTGDIGTEALNHRLRRLLNPENPSPDDPDLLVSSRGWCLGERLMQVKNNYDLEVFNGDMGNLVDLQPDGAVTLEMDDGRKIVYPKSATKDLVLGYAITVHKSQGGERPVILMPVSPSHTFSLNRNLLYTGITRGKKRVCLVGSPRTAVLAANKTDQSVRLTGLLHEIDALESDATAHPKRKSGSGFKPA